MADEYVLRVTAGPGYEESQHVVVPVNQSGTVHIRSELANIELNVRIRDFHGLPLGSPSSSPYFECEPHASNADQYSISFRFTPLAISTLDPVAKRPRQGTADKSASSGISGKDLVFGNDFDHSIRERLPPGFNKALSIVKWWIDPGLEGDAYADKPYLYGPALSSFNCVHVGEGNFDEDRGGLWIEEGGDEEGQMSRAEHGMPEDSRSRMKWALTEENKCKWTFEYGRTYSFDFFNAYLDFSALTLRLPGFHLPIMKYWDGQGLRYVLRNRTSGDVYLVVLFTLHLKADIKDDDRVETLSKNQAASPGVMSPAPSPNEQSQTKARSSEGMEDPHRIEGGIPGLADVD